MIFSPFIFNRFRYFSWLLLGQWQRIQRHTHNVLCSEVGWTTSTNKSNHKNRWMDTYWPSVFEPFVGPKHLHLWPQIICCFKCAEKTCWSLDCGWKRNLLQSGRNFFLNITEKSVMQNPTKIIVGHSGHLFVSDEIWSVSFGCSCLQVQSWIHKFSKDLIQV